MDGQGLKRHEAQGEYAPNCLAASKASSGVFAAMLVGVGMPYYAQARRFATSPKTRRAERTYRVEEANGLVLVDGQEAFLTGRDGLETVR